MPKSKVKTKSFGTTNIRRFINDIPGSVLQVNRKYVHDIAEIAARDVRQRIRRQLYNHEPLSPAYLKQKIETGHDRRILIRTGKYVRSIGVIEVQFSRGIGYRVGVPEDAREEDGTLLTEVARKNEWGTSTQPARPHFRPVYQELAARIATLRANAVRNMSRHLENEMRKLRSKGVKLK